MLLFGGNALRRWIAALAFSLVCIASLAAEDAPTEEAAHRATRLFGQALEQGDEHTEVSEMPLRLRRSPE